MEGYLLSYSTQKLTVLFGILYFSATSAAVITGSPIENLPLCKRKGDDPWPIDQKEVPLSMQKNGCAWLYNVTARTTNYSTLVCPINYRTILVSKNVKINFHIQ